MTDVDLELVRAVVFGVGGFIAATAFAVYWLCIGRILVCGKRRS